MDLGAALQMLLTEVITSIVQASTASTIIKLCNKIID